MSLQLLLSDFVKQYENEKQLDSFPKICIVHWYVLMRVAQFYVGIKEEEERLT